MFVHSNLCGAVKYEAGKDVYVVDCGDQVGSVVKITQEGKHLTLCEVEVLGQFSFCLYTMIHLLKRNKQNLTEI